MSIYYSFNRSPQSFLNAKMLLAMSSLRAIYGLESSYLTPVVYFAAFSFGHLAWSCSTPKFYRRTVGSILTVAHRTLTFSTYSDNIACWVTCYSPSLWCVQCSLGNCHCAVFSIFYLQCHSEVFRAPYGHLHSSTYRRSPGVMNIPSPRTASSQNDAAAGHSCHFNTVLYPKSYSQCQLPLNPCRRYIPGAAFSVQNYHKIFVVTALSSLHLCRLVNIYIMLYSVPL
jgi:hypothetical protein